MEDNAREGKAQSSDVATLPRDRLTFFCFARSGRMVLTRLRLLMTSVLREMGRGRPCSLRNRPQALQRTEPISSRRHSGVVDVAQFWHVGCVVSRSLLAIVAIMGLFVHSGASFFVRVEDGLDWTGYRLREIKRYGDKAGELIRSPWRIPGWRKI